MSSTFSPFRACVTDIALRHKRASVQLPACLPTVLLLFKFDQPQMLLSLFASSKIQNSCAHTHTHTKTIKDPSELTPHRTPHHHLTSMHYLWLVLTVITVLSIMLSFHLRGKKMKEAVRELLGVGKRKIAGLFNEFKRKTFHLIGMGNSIKSFSRSIRCNGLMNNYEYVCVCVCVCSLVSLSTTIGWIGMHRNTCRAVDPRIVLFFPALQCAHKDASVSDSGLHCSVHVHL